MPMKTTTDDPPVVNMIPMIDILFNLIIFLLVTTSFVNMERDIGLRVPEVSGAAGLTEAPSPRVVNVHKDGAITLDSRPVTLDELTRLLGAARSQYRDLRVLVRGDGRGPFQRVAEVLSACKQAGITDLGISVRIIQSDR